MSLELAAAFLAALRAGWSHVRGGTPQAACAHFERAHVLGQWHVYAHVRAHWGMLIVGAKLRDVREVTGQLYRIVGALLLTPLGRLPVGNSGRARVSALLPMPIDPGTRALLESDFRSRNGLRRLT